MYFEQERKEKRKTESTAGEVGRGMPSLSCLLLSPPPISLPFCHLCSPPCPPVLLSLSLPSPFLALSLSLSLCLCVGVTVSVSLSCLPLPLSISLPLPFSLPEHEVLWLRVLAEKASHDSSSALGCVVGLAIVLVRAFVRVRDQLTHQKSKKKER